MKLRALGVALGVALAAGAASCGGDDEAAPTSTVVETTATTTTLRSTTTTTTTEATTVAETSTTTTEPEGPTTPADVLAADGITSPEDAAVFVVTSWIAGDRAAASRHAETGALDSLFAESPPPAESLELVECDTADLERYDCFFTADGEIIIIGVERLRVVDATIDRD